jgi:hypothetical protein
MPQMCGFLQVQAWRINEKILIFEVVLHYRGWAPLCPEKAVSEIEKEIAKSVNGDLKRFRSEQEY